VTFSLGVIFSVLLIVGTLLRLKWRIRNLERKNKKLSLPINVS
jgi:putative membrane protein